MEEKIDSGSGEWFRRRFMAKNCDARDAARPAAPAKVAELGSTCSAPAPGELKTTLPSSFPKPLAASAEIAALKHTLEFQQSLKTRLNLVNSIHDLLLYSYEVLLDKFMALQDMGMLEPRVVTGAGFPAPEI